MDVAGSINASHNLVVVDSFRKWLEIKKKNMVTGFFFLHEQFANYVSPDAIVSINRTQFIAYPFNKLCKIFIIEYITISTYPQVQTEKLNGLLVYLREL